MLNTTKLTIITTAGILALFPFGAGAQANSRSQSSASSSRSQHLRAHRRRTLASRRSSQHNVAAGTESMTLYRYNPNANGGFATSRYKAKPRINVAKQMAQPAPDTADQNTSGASLLPRTTAQNRGAAGNVPATSGVPAYPYATGALGQANQNAYGGATGLYGSSASTPSLEFATGYGYSPSFISGNQGSFYGGQPNLYGGQPNPPVVYQSNPVYSTGYGDFPNDAGAGVGNAYGSQPNLYGSRPNPPLVDLANPVYAPNAGYVPPVVLPPATNPGSINDAVGNVVRDGRAVAPGVNTGTPNRTVLSANSIIAPSLEAGNRIRLHWIGQVDGLLRVRFLLLDSRMRVLRSAMAAGQPTDILFPMSRRNAYYGARLYFSNGTSQLMLSRF